MNDHTNKDFYRRFDEMLYSSCPKDLVEIESRCAKGMSVEEAIRDLIFVRWGLSEKPVETQIQ